MSGDHAGGILGTALPGIMCMNAAPQPTMIREKATRAKPCGLLNPLAKPRKEPRLGSLIVLEGGGDATVAAVAAVCSLSPVTKAFANGHHLSQQNQEHIGDGHEWKDP